MSEVRDQVQTGQVAGQGHWYLCLMTLMSQLGGNIPTPRVSEGEAPTARGKWKGISHPQEEAVTSQMAVRKLSGVYKNTGHPPVHWPTLHR